MSIDLRAGPPLQRQAARTIFEKSVPGRRAFSCPDTEVDDFEIAELIPAHARRAQPPRLPEVSEPELVRHYVGVSKRNYDLDSGFYPLGSCTMKHNPRLHERAAALPGHSRLHPLQDEQDAHAAQHEADRRHVLAQLVATSQDRVHQRPARTTVAVDERMDRLELHMDDPGLDDSGKIRALFVEKALKVAHAFEHQFRGRRDIGRISGPTATNPILTLPELSWLFATASPL